MKQSKSQPLTPEALARIEKVLDHHDTYKNSYFWNNNGNSKSRTAREQQLNFTVSIDHDGNCYEYRSSVTISRANFYYKGRFTKNGNKGDVRLFKKLLAGK